MSNLTDNTITMREVLDWIESGRPFRCTCVAYDRRRHTGGSVIELHEAVMLQRSASRSEAAARGLTRTEKLRARLGKNPGHGQWFTRNVQVLQQGQPTAIIKKIHPPLILTFNGKEMLV